LPISSIFKHDHSLFCTRFQSHSSDTDFHRIFSRSFRGKIASKPRGSQNEIRAIFNPLILPFGNI